MPDNTTAQGPAVTDIASFFRQPTVTVTLRAIYADGQVTWPAVVGSVVDHDVTGVLLRDATGLVRFVPWNIVVSIRAGARLTGDW